MGGGIQKKNSCKGRLLEKKIMQRRSEEKILQSELHCRADKLYLPEGHVGSHFIRQYCLVLVESPFPYN